MIAVIILAVLACILIGSGAYFTGMSKGYDEGFRAGWHSADDFWSDKKCGRDW